MNTVNRLFCTPGLNVFAHGLEFNGSVVLGNYDGVTDDTFCTSLVVEAARVAALSNERSAPLLVEARRMVIRSCLRLTLEPFYLCLLRNLEFSVLRELN